MTEYKCSEIHLTSSSSSLSLSRGLATLLSTCTGGRRSSSSLLCSSLLFFFFTTFLLCTRTCLNVNIIEIRVFLTELLQLSVPLSFGLLEVLLQLGIHLTRERSLIELLSLFQQTCQQRWFCLVGEGSQENRIIQTT